MYWAMQLGGSFAAPTTSFHHTQSSAQIEFISLSFVRQFLTLANSSDSIRGSEKDSIFVYNRFGAGANPSQIVTAAQG